MKYKFIGTEQDLIDNGFERLGDSEDLFYIYTNHPLYPKEKLMINVVNKMVVFMNTTVLRDTNEHSLKKWIDKGLVIKYE